MLKSASTIFLFIWASLLAAQNSTRIKIDQLPTEPKTFELFLAGSFNKWNPADANYQFQRMGNGQFYIDIVLPAGTYEYKITRGNWQQVECKADGSQIENRLFKVEGEQSLVVTVEQWKDNFSEPVVKHSASINVSTIDTAFFIPQLNRKRTITVYLPVNYSKSKARYPVLYLNDGQNVFDNARSYSGEWGIDEFLDTTKMKSCIVVAIDHGGNKRMNEYNPNDHANFGKGEGAAYVDFLAKTLKPYIDRYYRTRKQKENTFIAGSSMGGLISFYAILKYPKIFGGAGVFSPAFWVAPGIYDEIKAKGKKVKASIYFFAGKQEGETMVPYMLKVFEGISAVSKSKISLIIRDKGMHNEATWRKEFPGFYQWLLN